MQIGESFRIGWHEIAQHGTRSFLTMLGVIFGVAAVISTAAIGAGAREELDRQLAQLGANTIRVKAAKLRGAEESAQRRQNPWGIVRADADALARLLPGIERTALIKRIELQVVSQGRTIAADIVGTNEHLPPIVGYQVDEGRFLTAVDNENAALVCVIGDSIRRAAFPLEDPISKTLTIDGRQFVVVGVMAPRSRPGSGTAIETVEVDRAVFIPVTASIRRIGTSDPRSERLDEIIMKATDGSTLREAAALTERVLLRRHNGIADFRVVVPEELIRQQQKTKNVLSNVLLFIATISLLVGGIGIMNIMLASVTQRTREIGIRRALGGTRKDILMQFIVESLIISLCGGVAGIAMGYALATGIAHFAQWTTIVPMQAVVVSVSVSAAVGFLFGFYPSLKAARLDPIEALRAE